MCAFSDVNAGEPGYRLQSFGPAARCTGRFPSAVVDGKLRQHAVQLVPCTGPFFWCYNRPADHDHVEAGEIGGEFAKRFPRDAFARVAIHCSAYRLARGYDPQARSGLSTWRYSYYEVTASRDTAATG